MCNERRKETSAADISYNDQEKKISTVRKSPETLNTSNDSGHKQMHKESYKHIAVALSDIDDGNISLTSLTPSPNTNKIGVADFIHSTKDFWKYSFNNDQQYLRLAECSENPEQSHLTVHDCILHEIGKGLPETLFLSTITRNVLQQNFKRRICVNMKNIHTSHDPLAKHWWCVIASNVYHTYHEYDSLQSGKCKSHVRMNFSDELQT